MATKKTTTKKATAKAAPKKTAAAKTKVTTKAVVAKPAVETPADTTKATVVKAPRDTERGLPRTMPNIIVAEIVGTFVLTLAALFSTAVLSPLYVGLTLMLIVFAIGAVSGAHVNPAVTFGLWTMRKVKTVMVPFYWVSQFLGAMAAVVLLGSLTGGAFSVHFDKFMDFSWSIFAVEFVATAIFMFGVAAVLSRHDIKATGKAVGIGTALLVGLLVSSVMFPFAQSAATANLQNQQNTQQAKPESGRNYPRELYIGGATLNPAVALAVTEKTDSQLQAGNPLPGQGEKAFSRLSAEVIAATLLGAALGGNLFLLTNFRSKQD